MTDRVLVTSETVKINSIRQHPANPRRGDIAAIAESLQYHGQYRPIVVQRGTNYILAGNHTWQAAKSLGWENIAVTWLDCDPETAARVLVADNRASDLATYDDNRLLGLLKNLPDLDGTGFDKYDLDRLEGVFDRPINLNDDPINAEPGGGSSGDNPQIRIGEFHIRVEKDAWNDWVSAIGEGRKKSEILRDLRKRLGLLPPPKDTTPNGAERPSEGSEIVALNLLKPYPHNARQGDIGAIAESLAALGQYRPIVANRRDNTILVGNHTWEAARQLGWSRIAVNWVDVDETEAAKIVAVDNRTSDLATYDDDLLGTLLASLRSIEGTGFTSSDLDDLLHIAENGGKSRRPASTSKVACIVGSWGWKSTRDEWANWKDGLAPEIADGSVYGWIAHTLALPEHQWTSEEP